MLLALGQFCVIGYQELGSLSQLHYSGANAGKSVLSISGLQPGLCIPLVVHSGGAESTG